MGDRIMQHLPDYYQLIEDFRALDNTETIELDLLQGAVDQLFNDQFVMTSGLQAIRRREQMLGIQAKPSESLEFRRRRILNRYQTKPPFTIRFLQQQLDMLAGPGMAIAAVDAQACVLTITTNVSNASVFGEIAYTVATIKPVNMAYQQAAALDNVIEAEESIGMRQMNWRYKLNGSWQLGATSFVTYGPEVTVR
jgi:hypothetical protein